MSNKTNVWNQTTPEDSTQNKSNVSAASLTEITVTSLLGHSTGSHWIITRKLIVML